MLKPAIRALLVEDDPISAMIVSSLLTHLDVAHDTAASSLMAMEAYRDTHYPLVLLDCELPDGNGTDTAREMRKVDVARNTHSMIIALSAHDDSQTIAASLAAGMDKHLTKPIDLQQLQSIIRRTLAETTHNNHK